MGGNERRPPLRVIVGAELEPFAPDQDRERDTTAGKAAHLPSDPEQCRQLVQGAQGADLARLIAHPAVDNCERCADLLAKLFGQERH
jgi:hypothetical protein